MSRQPKCAGGFAFKMIDLEVKGLIEARRKQEQMIRDVRGAPILNAMRDATLLVTRDAKINAPVDTDRLRASITPEIRTMGDEIVGVVGSNVAHAPYMEFGTAPHFPPVGALDIWAERHGGANAFLIARAISRSGLAARKFLQKAFESNKDRIIKRFDRALNEIVEKK